MMCPQCHTYYDEWDPTKGGDVHAYYPQNHTCLGCKARDDAYAAARVDARERDSDTATHGLQVRLVRNETASKPPLPLAGKMYSKLSGR
jgi:hypothetical protein